MGRPQPPKEASAKLELSFPRYKRLVAQKEYCLTCHARMESDVAFALNTVAFYVGDVKCRAELQPRYALDEVRRSHRFKLAIYVSLDKAGDMPIQNPLKMRFVDEGGEAYSAFVKYISKLNKYFALHGPYYYDEEHSLCAFFRQTLGKNTTFTVRHKNVTDAWPKRAELAFAWLVSLVARWIDPIILFEKNCQHYEESGRVVFERLVDEGVDNAWFVLRGDILDSLDIDPKYKRRILRQHSFKHYLYYFRSHRFFGSETLGHCLELRCQSLFVQWRARQKSNWYVFLQHGVMYMISLDSSERSFFRKSSMKCHCLVVTSSELESNHFIESAGFDREDLLVCGLPKFDKAYQNPGADKILIMPTWRVWEFNSMRLDPDETDYMKMINRIADAIPEQLRDKVVVIPHPLFNAQIFGAAAPKTEKSYDELLRDVKVLITDYSSIVYDAFYRGANVIFYWGEKDKCLDHYGPSAHLLVNEETVFGPVCYDEQDVEKAVLEAYDSAQPQGYVQRFNKIVEFHDGKNTERLINELRSRNLI